MSCWSRGRESSRGRSPVAGRDATGLARRQWRKPADNGVKCKSRIAIMQSGFRRPTQRPPVLGLERLQVFRGRLAGLAVRHDLEGNALAFPQLAQPGALDSADMDEHILATALRLDESITLLGVEPLHGAVVHGSLLVDMPL